MEEKNIGKRVEELLKRKNLSNKEYAKKMGISEKKLQKKLNGEEDFLVSEVILTANIFHLETNEVAKIFFS